MRIKRIALPITCILLLSSMIAGPVQASNLKEQLENYQSQHSEIQEDIQEQKEEISKATAQAISLEKSIQVLNEKIKDIQENLKQEEAQLEILHDKQEQLELERENHIKALAGYLKNQYINGTPGYLDYIFGASSFRDFITRFEEVKYILNTYNGIYEELNTLNEELETQKQEIIKQKQIIASSLEAEQENQRVLEQALSKQNEVLSQLTKEEKELYKKSQKVESEIERIKELIAHQEMEARLAAQNPISNTGGANSITAPVVVEGGAKVVLDYAATLLGVPYLWGGTTPKGFDCSGFTQYVFRNAGITLPRVSQDQYNQGIAVEKSDLKAGDLVFFTTYGPGATHVGIYVGNNIMIHSSSGGVRYENMENSYFKPRYLGARRIIAE